MNTDEHGDGLATFFIHLRHVTDAGIGATPFRLPIRVYPCSSVVFYDPWR
jgi:hypothetical protein